MTNNNYKPGTVAKATVRGVPNVTVFRTGNGSGWALDRSLDGPLGSFRDLAGDEVVTHVRPLVVLDLNEVGLSGNYDVRRANLLEHLRKGTNVALRVADQIEAQTKPPKPAEPTGLGAVVEDDLGRRWVRIDDDPELNKPWRPADMAAIRSHWQNVKAARVLSEGVA